MGIANLTRYLRQLIQTVLGLNETISARPSEPVSAIAIDLGYLLYRSVSAVIKKDLVCQATDLEQSIIDQTISELDLLIGSIATTDQFAIYLVLDGIPSLNKIRSHLNRTTAHLIQRGCEQAILKSWSAAEPEHSDHPTMLHNRDVPIYPGSPIILALEDRLRSWCSERTDQIVASYSSSGEPGEGEIKIAVWCQQWFQDHPDQHLLVIGVDTDLLLSPIVNVYDQYHVLLQNTHESDCCYHLSALIDVLYQHYLTRYSCSLSKTQFAYGFVWSVHLLGNEVLPPVIQPYQMELQYLLDCYCRASGSCENPIIRFESGQIHLDRPGLAQFYRLIQAEIQPVRTHLSHQMLVLPSDAHQEVADMKKCKNLWRDIVPAFDYQSDDDDCNRYLCQMITCMHQIIAPDGSVLLDWYHQSPMISAGDLATALDHSRYCLNLGGICQHVSNSERLSPEKGTIQSDVLAALLLSDPKQILDPEIRPFLPQGIANQVVSELIGSRSPGTASGRSPNNQARCQSRWATSHGMLQIGPLPILQASTVHHLLISKRGPTA